MKVKEVTNPEEQLALLRVIIDNTWGAIKQQADTYARQRAAKPVAKTRIKKTAPYAVKTQATPKIKAPNQVKPQIRAPAMSSNIGKALYTPPKPASNMPKQALSNKSNNSLTNLEKDDVINLPRGALPKLP